MATVFALADTEWISNSSCELGCEVKEGLIYSENQGDIMNAVAEQGT